MTTMQKLITLLPAYLWIAACQTKTESLHQPIIETPLVIEASEVISQSIYQPKLTVLFVVDDSDSMKDHQKNVARHAKSLVRGYQSYPAMDIHFGVVTVWDSERYGHVVKPVCHLDDSTNYLPMGQLRSVQNSGSKASYFLLNQGDFLTSLENHIQVGISEYFATDQLHDSKKLRCAKGSEFEEYFSPALAALKDPERLNSTNKGFHDPSRYLHLIFIGDATDASSVTVEQMYHELARIQETPGNNSRFSVTAITIPKGTPINRNSTCKSDPSLHFGSDKQRLTHTPANKLEELAKYRNHGHVVSLCLNGESSGVEFDRLLETQLLEVGSKVATAVQESQYLFLPSGPEPKDGSLDLRFGASWEDSEQLSMGLDYTYNFETRRIRFKSGQPNWSRYPNGRIWYRYQGVNPMSRHTRPVIRQ